MSDFQIVSDDAEVYAEIVRRFEAYNTSRTDWGSTVFSIVQRDNERIVAAARGITNMGLVEVRGVWVDEGLREHGIGRALMNELEAEARRRGCTRAALDTYSWQASGFYMRLGYREYAKLDYPNGTSRHFFEKDL
ncbi:MAG: GNAT family N-acetyltransferase [Pseudomonadota bacterium]